MFVSSNQSSGKKEGVIRFHFSLKTTFCMDTTVIGAWRHSRARRRGSRLAAPSQLQSCSAKKPSCSPSAPPLFAHLWHRPTRHPLVVGGGCAETDPPDERMGPHTGYELSPEWDFNIHIKEILHQKYSEKRVLMYVDQNRFWSPPPLDDICGLLPRLLHCKWTVYPGQCAWSPPGRYKKRGTLRSGREPSPTERRQQVTKSRLVRSQRW